MTDTAPDTGTDAPDDTPETTEATDTDATDWKAEAEKFKALARKQEDRAKANAAAAKELDELRKASMTDLEKAIEETKALTRAEVMLEVAADRVDDAVRLAASGTPLDVEALLEGLDRKRFISDDGQVDTDRVKAYVESITPKIPEGTPDFAGIDLGQGTRTTPALGSDPLLQALKNTVGAR